MGCPGFCNGVCSTQQSNIVAGVLCIAAGLLGLVPVAIPIEAKAKLLKLRGTREGRPGELPLCWCCDKESRKFLGV